jgi:hypothetical protein
MKAQRPYTVTPKVLAACRRNLAKANLVDKLIRFRSTPRRRAACRRNLLKAQKVVRKADASSRAYATCFRHGLDCISLERSLELVGETPAEFRAHLDLFRRAFQPHGRRERTLVRGLAEASVPSARAAPGRPRNGDL